MAVLTVQVAVGIGTLAGSTIMLLTVAWGGSLVAGRCDLNSQVCAPRCTKPCFPLGLVFDFPAHVDSFEDATSPSQMPACNKIGKGNSSTEQGIARWVSR